MPLRKPSRDGQVDKNPNLHKMMLHGVGEPVEKKRKIQPKASSIEVMTSHVIDSHPRNRKSWQVGEFVESHEFYSQLTLGYR
jgi:hypothetical protein